MSADHTAKRLYRKGLLIALAASVLFSTKAVIIKLAYQYEVSSISLLGLRMIGALPFFLFIGYWRSRRTSVRDFQLRLRHYIIIAGLGLCGYYLASYTDFLGLQYLSAGMERLILFTYPTLVLLLGFVLYRRQVGRRQIGATAIAYFGIVVAFSGADYEVGTGFLRGAGLIFISALLYAGFVLGSGIWAPRLGSIRFNSLALTAAGIGVITHALVAGAPLLGLAAPVYGYAALMAIFATVLPSYLMAEGIRRIGPGSAAIVSSIGPVSTIVLEYYLLGEILSVTQWAGGLLIVSGVLLISKQK